jgi:hypothetical protein
MRLPDPFTPNLKVDLLPEILQTPRIRTDYLTALSERGLRQRLDSVCGHLHYFGSVYIHMDDVCAVPHIPPTEHFPPAATVTADDWRQRFP